MHFDSIKYYNGLVHTKPLEQSPSKAYVSEENNFCMVMNFLSCQRSSNDLSHLWNFETAVLEFVHIVKTWRYWKFVANKKVKHLSAKMTIFSNWSGASLLIVIIILLKVCNWKYLLWHFNRCKHCQRAALMLYNWIFFFLLFYLVILL